VKINVVPAPAEKVTVHKAKGRTHDKDELQRQLHGARVPMWIFDRDTLDILEVNQAATVEYGYKREEFLTMTILHLRPEVDGPLILKKVLHPSLAGPSKNENWRHRRKDGTTFMVSVSSQWLRWNDRPAELVAARPCERQQSTSRKNPAK
jgi:PAS domain S-box-containing protein